MFIAHETKVLSITQLLGDLGASPAEAPAGGITIIQRGPRPALIVNGKILDPVTGFSTSLNFPLPRVQIESALHASGVPIGTPTKDSPFARMGTFVPHVIVRNLLGTPQRSLLEKTLPEVTIPRTTLREASGQLWLYLFTEIHPGVGVAGPARRDAGR